MDETQRSAFLQSQSVCALIEALGMAAENQQAAWLKQPIYHGEGAFKALIEKYGIHHNAALSTLHGE